MSEHTPLPWICDSEGILPISRDGISVVARIPNHPDNKINWDADAAYIVKACNAFPDLVKALEECAAAYSTPPGSVVQCSHHIGVEFQRRMDIAGRALAAVKSPSTPTSEGA